MAESAASQAIVGRYSVGQNCNGGDIVDHAKMRMLSQVGLRKFKSREVGKRFSQKEKRAGESRSFWAVKFKFYLQAAKISDRVWAALVGQSNGGGGLVHQHIKSQLRRKGRSLGKKK